MKKLLLLSAILLATFSFTQAQDGGGFRRGNNPEMNSKMKQRIKDELKLTDVQTDSVMSINQRYRMKMDALRSSNIDGREKEMQIVTLNADRIKELKTILTDEQIQKLKDIMQTARKMREERKDE